MEVWELMARESARDLITRYNANGDSGRIEQMVAVFAPDAIFETGEHRFEGRDAIFEFMSGVVSAQADTGTPAPISPRSPTGRRGAAPRSCATSPAPPRST